MTKLAMLTAGTIVICWLTLLMIIHEWKNHELKKQKRHFSNLTLEIMAVLSLALVGLSFYEVNSIKVQGYDGPLLYMVSKDVEYASQNAPSVKDVKANLERYKKAEKNNNLDEMTIIIYKFGCVHCQAAYQMSLEDDRFASSDKVIWLPSTRTDIGLVASATTAPTLYHKGEVVGGYDETVWKEIIAK